MIFTVTLRVDQLASFLEEWGKTECLETATSRGPTVQAHEDRKLVG